MYLVADPMYEFPLYILQRNLNVPPLSMPPKYILTSALEPFGHTYHLSHVPVNSPFHKYLLPYIEGVMLNRVEA